MKILAIGDPHGDLEKIKKIPKRGMDLILLTGDIGKANLARKMAFTNITRRKEGLKEIEYSAKEKKKAFMEGYNSTIKLIVHLSKFAPVYLIYGNVESTNRETKEYSKHLGLPLPSLTNKLNKIKDVKIINNKFVRFKGLKIGGLSYFVDEIWVKKFKPSNYKEKLIEAKKQTKRARKILTRFNELDILLCHQPPLGILDKVTFKEAPKYWIGKNAGSKVILDYVKNKKPKYVFCGHIHEGKGNKKIGKSSIHNLGVCGYKIIKF